MKHLLAAACLFVVACAPARDPGDSIGPSRVRVTITKRVSIGYGPDFACRIETLEGGRLPPDGGMLVTSGTALDKVVRSRDVIVLDVAPSELDAAAEGGLSTRAGYYRVINIISP